VEAKLWLETNKKQVSIKTMERLASTKEHQCILNIFSSTPPQLAPDLHSQAHPTHSPVPWPLAWQSIRQVEAAAQSKNWLGVRNSSEHVQPYVPQVPVLLPREWQVPSQTAFPRWHLDGRRARKLLREIDDSEHQHFPASSHKPEVCPRATQPAVQAQLPKVHLNPPWVPTIKSEMNMNIFII